MFYVYVLKNSVDNSIFYVGKGKGSRMFDHVRNAKGKNSRCKHNPKLYNKIKSILKSGNYIIHEVIFENENEKKCLDYEMLKIKEIGLSNLTNITLGGEGTYGKSAWCKGKKLSDTTKLKMSLSKKGRTLHKQDAKTRDKISKAMLKKHKTYSVVEKERIRNTLLMANIGKRKSQETKDKIARANIGKRKSQETKDKIANTLKERYKFKIQHVIEQEQNPGYAQCDINAGIV